MKGSKKFFTLLFPLFFIAVAFIGCSPVGGLQFSDVKDHIRAEPKKFVYTVNYDPFIPEEDVEVVGVFKGIEKPIAIKDVKIIISEYKWSSSSDNIVLDVGEKEEVKIPKKGIKNVTIYYNDLETFYRISVGETGTGDDDDDSGVTIDLGDWKKK